MTHLNSSARRILLVDDEELILKILSRKLEATGTYQVFTASNGEEALGFLKTRDVDLVITDIRMPRMDGITLLKEIRNRWPSMPVIIITGYGTLDDAIEALRLGAVNFVKKPFDLTELFITLERIFSERETRGESVEALRTITRLSISHQIGPDFDLIRKVISFVLGELRRYWQLSSEALLDTSVCLYEAMLNALEHGTLEVPIEEKEALQNDPRSNYEEYLRRRSKEEPWCHRHITLDLEADPLEARFTITDEGPGFNIRSLPDPTRPENLLRTRGRGLLLIFNIADEVKISPKGNSITIIKRRSSLRQSELVEVDHAFPS